MKSALHFTAWSFVALAIVYAAVGPHGALLNNPLACIGVGLIGLGIAIEMRRRLPALSIARKHTDTDATREHEE